MFSSLQNILWISEFQFWQYWRRIGQRLKSWNLLCTILLLYLIYINCCLLESLTVVEFIIKGLTLSIGTLLTFLVLISFLLKSVFSSRAKKRLKVTES